MPELAELYGSARLISACGASHVFGSVSHSDVAATKWPSLGATVLARWPRFRVHARSRGKELAVWFTRADDAPRKLKREPKRDAHADGDADANADVKPLVVRFHHGMSGFWEFTPVAALHKHAHARFHTADGAHVLAFVDMRRFGGWEVMPDAGAAAAPAKDDVVPRASCWPFAADRGPCPVREHDAFVAHLRANVRHAALYDKPLGEVMLDQRFFNGVGNYLRAEIVHRASLNPFGAAGPQIEAALAALDAAPTAAPAAARRKTAKKEAGAAPAAETRDVDGVAVPYNNLETNFVRLCRQVPVEVLLLDNGAGYYQGGGTNSFESWLQCYGKAKSIRDGAGRMLWYTFAGKPPASFGKGNGGGGAKRARKAGRSRGAAADADAPAPTEAATQAPVPARGRSSKAPKAAEAATSAKAAPPPRRAASAAAKRSASATRAAVPPSRRVRTAARTVQP